MRTAEEQIFEQIKKAKNILITFHKDWSGDAVASALAMHHFLKNIGKKADIVAEKNNQGMLYSFLPGFDNIKHPGAIMRNFVISLDLSQTEVEKVQYFKENNKLNFVITPKGDNKFSSQDVSTFVSSFNYDLIISLNTTDLESLGGVYEKDTDFFYKTPIINIDHQSANEEYGQINHIELTSVSTSEILHNLLEKYDPALFNKEIATCLLAGMIANTRSFKTPNVTPRSLATAAKLMALGADREMIVNSLYRSRPLGVLKLWGRVLARLSSSEDGKLVWSVLLRLDFQKTQTSELDVGEVIDELIISIPSAKVIVLLYEKNGANSGALTEKTGSLVYSVKNIDSLKLAKEFNPTGTRKLAKFIVEKPITEAEKIILQSIKKRLDQLPI
ncbi:hypothetical protein D6821_02085 [Candidatus Parcubacteria bacterium]|nr:MAG: hypothetical protein D6821_02085 [Candidatus Parcubacteria bacterium]